ncbi:hypothetical protein GCM10007928_51250 [Sulfitobacter porphyrae]|nr:hypothetical protein GCM10007928_51250 [Sulfitobacter porphyrae]
MSTAVDFERGAELVATKTVQTHLAARGGYSGISEQQMSTAVDKRHTSNP